MFVDSMNRVAVFALKIMILCFCVRCLPITHTRFFGKKCVKNHTIYQKSVISF